MDSSKTSMVKEQRRYKRNFDKSLRLPRQKIHRVSFVFVCKD